MTQSFHDEVKFVPESVLVCYPSTVTVNVLREHEDTQCVRHALALCIAALTANGENTRI